MSIQVHGRSLSAALVFVALLPLARAQDNDAEQLFRTGQRLLREGRTSEACVAFARSNQAEHNISTLLNLASCEEKDGKLASAWKLFVEAAEDTKGDPGQQALHDVANDRAAKLEPRVSFVTVMVPDEVAAIPGLELRIDDVPLAATFWGSATALDGGPHQLVARAKGYEELRRTILVEQEGQRATVAVTLLRSPPATPASLHAHRSRWFAGLHAAHRTFTFGSMGLRDTSADVDVDALSVEAGRHRRLSRRWYVRVSLTAGVALASGDLDGVGVTGSVVGRVGVALLDGRLLLSVGGSLGYSFGAEASSPDVTETSSQLESGPELDGGPEVSYVWSGRLEVAARVASGTPRASPVLDIALRYHL
ncbi:MAG TPA: hypothetical protein VHE35_32065 [Kofleriaceae bacterium]|nr:hypothetical protein [Kofleriaceae bacterium]